MARRSNKAMLMDSVRENAPNVNFSGLEEVVGEKVSNGKKKIAKEMLYKGLERIPSEYVEFQQMYTGLGVYYLEEIEEKQVDTKGTNIRLKIMDDLSLICSVVLHNNSLTRDSPVIKEDIDLAKELLTHYWKEKDEVGDLVKFGDNIRKGYGNLYLNLIREQIKMEG